MMGCWERRPGKRPTFSDLCAQVDNTMVQVVDHIMGYKGIKENNDNGKDYLWQLLSPVLYNFYDFFKCTMYCKYMGWDSHYINWNWWSHADLYEICKCIERCIVEAYFAYSIVKNVPEVNLYIIGPDLWQFNFNNY